MLAFKCLKETKKNGDVNYFRVAINALILFSLYFGGGIIFGLLTR